MGVAVIGCQAKTSHPPLTQRATESAVEMVGNGAINGLENLVAKTQPRCLDMVVDRVSPGNGLLKNDDGLLEKFGVKMSPEGNILGDVGKKLPYKKLSHVGCKKVQPLITTSYSVELRRSTRHKIRHRPY